MGKILKKYTRIPEHLYVKRNADKELEIIINEMERPGYVLVARQMGKTNLLFNAMRTLKNDNRLLVYVDLSNAFELERDCYRNIIDNIIEPNENIFGLIENKIFEIRNQDLPPNKEYSKSLRVILNHFHGDLIIILDEVDALRSVKYSDHIFAQIRSNYFSRTNFPMLDKLTYILSGVIEPSELIKDRNKSPFNIGEKIYLDDFSYEEHSEFIEKSKLAISESDSEYIYSWTNGNPRLTFDICSEIENLLISNKNVNSESIFEVINNKYLVSFDIPPIDHIRELIKSNESARDAVISIQNGVNNISDELKKKLYLYGVISSNFNETTVIKNKVISKSLSLAWLSTLDNKSQITFTYGLAQYENIQYFEAIDTFTKIMVGLEETDLEFQNATFFLAYSHFHLKNYEEAITYFSFDFSDVERSRTAKSLIGICKLKDNLEEAFLILESVIEIETNDFAYHNALLNLAINLPKSEDKKSFLLYQKLYDSTFKAKDIKENELNKLRTLSLYYQAEIYSSEEDNKSALLKLQQAKEYANESDSLYIMFSEYMLDKNNNEDLIIALIRKIIDKKIKLDTNHSYPISFNEIHLLYYIDLIFKSQIFDLLDEILDYSVVNFFNKEKSKFEILYDVSYKSDTSKIELLNYILNHKSEIDELLYFNILKDLSMLNSSTYSKFHNYFDEYLEIFKNHINIDSADILLFAVAIKHESDLGKIDKSLTLCSLIDTKIENIQDEELIFESLIIYYWYATLYFSIKNKEQSILYANKTIEIINESKKERTSAIDEKGLKDISKQMMQIKDSWISRIPFISGKKHGRNDIVKVKYLDGTIKETKYKRIEADILAERCDFV